MAIYKPRILVVDDEPQILRVLKASLPPHGCEVVVAANGNEALQIIQEQMPDLIILDLIMPGLSGLDVCKLVRKSSQVPIIILSAQMDSEQNSALNLGATDYLTKPFNLNDLLARMRAALRRFNNIEVEQGVLSVGDVTIDFSTKKVLLVSGKEVKLTPKEYDVLIYLMNNAEKLITRQHLVYLLWGTQSLEQTEQLRILINQLRYKIEPNPEKPRYILNEPGVGYKFCGN
ncbi:MAG: response regulator transcription factor [Acidobacteria bacterium]|nr:response regulator transcription factor [Acidobacteriota bacterium]